MKRIFTILCLILVCLGSGFAQKKDSTEVHFGFSLNPGANNTLVTYGIIFVKNGKITQVQSLSEEDWVKQVAGRLSSPANPQRKNLFIENKIDSCDILFDANYYEYGVEKYVGYECIPLRHLWKLRYDKHPFKHNAEGWSNATYAPKKGQMELLKGNYGISAITDWFYGPSMWRLLREIQIQEWQDLYKSGISHKSEEKEAQSENNTDGEQEQKEKDE